MWIISNKTIEGKEKLNYLSFGNYSFYSDRHLSEQADHQNIWFYDGYVLPRQDENEINNNPSALLEKYYLKYGEHFINHIKGNYIIIQLRKDGFKIYSDRFGIKKFFYWQKELHFIISDSIIEIKKHIETRPSAENMAIYALTYHFTGGSTIFENVMHNTPGQVIEYKDEKIRFSCYWNPENLLNLPKNRIDIADISDSLAKAVNAGLNQSSEKKISLSLTGGADTRNLLATFLNLGIKPHLYTYGNPNSADCMKASLIAKGLGLEHSIYDIRMDADLFEQYARKIIRLSGGLASIHRVHRLMAVENEAVHAKKMFLGTLGGEFIKGVSEDDYIVPSIVYDNWNNSLLSLDDLKKYLNKKRIKLEGDNADALLEFIQQEPYLHGTIINRKFNALSYITAHLHDAQDVNLYSSVMDEVFTPFLDIDYLELIFSSDFTFDQKELINNRFLKRMDNPVYASQFIRNTYKPLLKYKYSGEHKPSEVLFNKYYAALTKVFRQKTHPKYPPNFPLGKWMEEFVAKQLPLCADNGVINNTFDIQALLTDFKTTQHTSKESYWLKYTNPIMMRFIIEEFRYE